MQSMRCRSCRADEMHDMHVLLQGVRDSYEADGSPVEPASPLAVLVNRGTASASEVRPLQCWL